MSSNTTPIPLIADPAIAAAVARLEQGGLTVIDADRCPAVDCACCPPAGYSRAA